MAAFGRPQYKFFSSNGLLEAESKPYLVYSGQRWDYADSSAGHSTGFCGAFPATLFTFTGLQQLAHGLSGLRMLPFPLQIFRNNGLLSMGLGSRLRTELGWLGFGWMPITTLSSMKPFWGLLCSLINKQRLLWFSMQCVGHPSKVSSASSCKPIAWFWCNFCIPLINIVIGSFTLF